MNELIKLDYMGQRVLTTQQLSKSYECSVDNIYDNFRRNKIRYEFGKHYFCLEGLDLKEFRATRQEAGLQENANKIYLWTELGAFLHAKSLSSDRSWEAYHILLEGYFEMKKQIENNDLSNSINELKARTQWNNSVAKLTTVALKCCENTGLTEEQRDFLFRKTLSHIYGYNELPLNERELLKLKEDNENE